MPADDGATIVVIGAGIAGLSAAHELRDRGHEVLVIDKGRGVGGRTCIRTAGRWQFDHGAQYFTARDERFAARVDAWARDGIVAEWHPHLVAIDDDGVREAGTNTTRWVGTPGMNAPARALAGALDVRSARRVETLAWTGHEWHVATDDGALRADAVLLALPPAQAAELLPATSALRPALADIDLRPCWAVMLGFDTAPAIDFDAAFVNRGPLSWVCNDTSKPHRDGAPAWLLHAGPDWSTHHYHDEPGAVVAALTAALAALPGVELPAPAHFGAHRWRYSQPSDTSRELTIPCAKSERVACAGDWCAGGRIEGAWVAGCAAAAALHAALDG